MYGLAPLCLAPPAATRRLPLQAQLESEDVSQGDGFKVTAGFIVNTRLGAAVQGVCMSSWVYGHCLTCSVPVSSLNVIVLPQKSAFI